jgi:hypothetical protein
MNDRTKLLERTAWEEAVIVGLYTAVMQLSVLAGFSSEDHHLQIRVIIGTGVGIVCAHLFAAVLGRQYMAGAAAEPLDVGSVLGIVIGAVSVSALSLAPYLVFVNAEDPGEVASFVLVVVIGYAGFHGSRLSGRSLMRAGITALVMIVIASIVAGLKAWLTH